jgi:hypothetical protein
VARIRSIKPEFATDGGVLRLPDSTALFFILLWNHCDDYGYFTWDTQELALRTGRWRTQEVFKFLSALVHAGLVRCSSRVGVGLVNGWEHQYIPKKRPSKWNEMEIEWDVDAPKSQKKSVGKDRIGKDRIGKDGCELPAVVLTDTATPTVVPEKKTAKRRGPEDLEKSRQVREAYKSAYFAKYGIEPVFSVAENRNVNRLIEAVGHQEAVALASAYPAYLGDWHVKTKHPFNLLLRDVNKIRVELYDPRRMFDHVQVEKQLREGGEAITLRMEREALERQIEAEQNAKLLPEGA